MKWRLKQVVQGKLTLPKIGNQGLPPISLTSYPPRYGSLPLVLLNLLDQSQLPSKIYVWLADEDYNVFDASLIKLFQSNIIEFRKTKDYGCHKKWLPLVEEVNSPFVICDDDIFYPRNWYKSLLNSDDRKSYVAHRCHSVTISSDYQLKSYTDWDKDINILGAISHKLFPTGCGGALIYPERISLKFRDWNLISKTCPKADDIWLKVAHLDSGVPCKKSFYSFPCLEYADSQSISLMQTNVNLGHNDIQLANSLSQMRINIKKYFS